MLLAATAVVVTAGRVAAQAAQPTLEAVPGTVSLGLGETADVLLVVTNPTPAAITNVTASRLKPAGVDATVEGMDSYPVGALAPGQRVALNAHVRRSTDGVPPVGVVFRLDYVAGGAKQTATGLLTITPRVAAPPDKLVDVSVESALSDLNEFRHGTVFVVVTNVSDDKIILHSVAGAGPDNVTVAAGTAAGGNNPCKSKSGTGPQSEYVEDSLDVGQAHTFPFEVCSSDQVSPGKKLVLFTVDAANVGAGTGSHSTVVKSLTFQASVFGESELLAALGVPSFLFLPGFLVLVAFGMLRAAFGRRAADTGMVWADAKSAEFVLVAVTLALIAAPTYPAITGLLGRQRSYLNGYGVRDLIYVWSGSIVIGLVLGGLSVGAGEIQRAFAARRVLHEDDDPYRLLRFLQRTEKPLALQQVRVDDNWNGFLVAGDLDGTDPVWVSAGIRCNFTPAQLAAGAAGTLDAAIALGQPAAVLRTLKELKLGHNLDDDAVGFENNQELESVPITDPARVVRRQEDDRVIISHN